MTRRRRDEIIARLTRSIEVEAGSLREICALACLMRIEEIIEAYGHAPVLLERQEIDDRAVDLWAPLVALAAVADGEDGGGGTREILGVIREMSAVRDAEDESGQTAQLIATLEKIRRERGSPAGLTPAELLHILNQQPEFKWLKSTKALA